tara:strand:+ start:43 stop:621 length:579 start_codon:yes stop_codon:yes gene_type:complete
MIRIAVIGDIGSGKSYAAKQFGYPVFNADIEVDKLYKKNRRCFVKIKKKLPGFISTFPIKKNELSRAIIANQNNLKKIVKIIHPEVRFKMNSFVKKNKNKKFVVLDIPLILENKINKKNDILVFVDANQKMISKKLKKRKNINMAIIKKFKKLQLPIEFKKKKANFIVKNNFLSTSLKKNVKRIIEKINSNA